MSDGPYQRSFVRFGSRNKPGSLMYPLYAARQHAVVVTNSDIDPPRSRVMDLATGQTTATLPLRASGVVEDDAGRFLGLVVVGERSLMLVGADGTQRWTQSGLPRTNDDTAAALVVGDLLVVSIFHRIATGASLYALSWRDGSVRWIADVDQMLVSHSKYFNDVALERRGDRVVMRGYEAFGCYVQTFDLATGKRLSSSIHHP